MSHTIADTGNAAPRWYVPAALPETVKTAHLTARDPDDCRYVRSTCGTERSRLWDRVEDITTDTIKKCDACAATSGTGTPV
jgi:hypothetical protein